MRFSIALKVTDELDESEVAEAIETLLNEFEVGLETVTPENLTVKRRKEIDRKSFEAFRPGSKAEEIYGLIQTMVNGDEEFMSRAQIAVRLETTPSNVTAVLRRLKELDEDTLKAYAEGAENLPRTAPRRFVPSEKALSPRQQYLAIKNAIAEGETEFDDKALAMANEYAAFHGFNELVPAEAA